MRHKMRQLCNKIKDAFRGGSKSVACSCNWPELNKYFGLCGISTGIYVSNSISAIIVSASIAFNSYLIISIFNHIGYIGSNNEIDENDQDYILLFKGVAIFYIFWNAFKLFEVIRNLWAIYAVYMKKARALKILLYVGVPCWIFDFFLSSIASVILAFSIKSLLFLSFLFEGYNLLAISSQYKKLVGKSRIVPELDMQPRVDPIVLNEVVNQPHRNLRFPPSSNQPHCPTCTCFLGNGDNNEEETENSPELDNLPLSTELPNVTENCNEDIAKTLNFKDEVIIFNQEHLEERNSTLFENVGPSSTVGMNRVPAKRPNTLALKLQDNEEKKDIADTPVIYDENQLNIGKSPVIEDI